ncbi:MAG: hotdog fold thioesterase [Bdellovibrionota bacterium]
MSIWFKPYSVDEINDRGKSTMVEHLGIMMTIIGDDFLEGTMPVDHKTKQALGLLHGGALAAFSESLASTAASMTIDRSTEYCVGIEISANHMSSCTGGVVVGRTTPLHLGKSMQVWETRIHQDNKLVCASRVTLLVRKK